MEVGVGLPAAVPGTGGELLLEWARWAEQGPFASLGVLDRVAYDNYDPLLSLAVAAAVTTRPRLVTMVVIAPLRGPALLAKEAASLDALSGGRLTLGLAIGARHEDYDITGIDHRDRGKRFDEQLAYLRDAWEEGRGGPPRAFAGAASKAWAAWTDAGRPDRPRLWGQAYFALGGQPEIDRGAAYLRDYYAFTGPFAERIAAGNLTSPRMVKDLVRGYEEAGCDHLVLLPTVADLAQLERLADVLA